MSLRPRKPLAAPSVRWISDHVTFTSIDRTQRWAKSSADLQPHNSYKLSVPLLKSPSHFGHYTSRVNRMYNEDKYSACVIQVDGHPVFNFNVFDGHGGDQCANFLSANLARVVEQSDDLAASKEKRNALFKRYAKEIGGYWRRWYKSRDQNVQRMEQASPQAGPLSSINTSANALTLQLPMAFLSADYEFFHQEDNKSGSTCTSAYLETLFSDKEGQFKPVYESYYFNRRTVSRLTIAHVGDTKAILVDRNGEAQALTTAHHPSNPIEASRLRRYSANYFMTDSFGEERFISLANTRAFGDLEFKEMGVSAEPDVAQYIVGDAETISQKLTKDEIKEYTIGGLGGDEAFLLLCTDGVTNELTDQEIADIVMVNFNLRGHLKATPQFCAGEVVKFVEYIGGDDNATCLVIRLSGWGKWPAIDRTGDLRQERLNDYQPRDRG